jgi:hypothetical protein
MKTNTITFAILLIASILYRGLPVQAESKRQKSREVSDELERRFFFPPESAKPGVLWMWMGSNISREGITRDLEAIKAAGFGRTTMFNVADITSPFAYDIPNSQTPEIIAWTEPWWKLVRFAAEESKRLGLDFGMFNGAGYEASGGVWVTPELSMQQICFSEMVAEGSQDISITLPMPEVDLRAVQDDVGPVHNPENGKLEYPIIQARKTACRDIAVVAVPAQGVISKNQVIDLSKKMSSEGKLTCSLPGGKWKIYRFSHTTLGNGMHPSQWKARGFECDKMSREAVELHMNHIIGEIKKHLGDLIGTGFTHVHFDSYEAGMPSWTPKMREEFMAHRGYDLLPYLASFAKRTITSQEETEQFKKDFEATILDLHNEIYYSTIQRTLNDAKLEFLCEPYGGPWRKDEIMPKVDRVMTEFWTTGGKYSPYEVEPTITVLRKSGQNIIEAEAFTGNPGDSKWAETPEWLKPIGDAAFCAGINRMVLHRFAHQPWDNRYKPGQTMGQWGTHFDRTQTWWEAGKSFFKYLHRCQALLQWGEIAHQPGQFKVLSDNKDHHIQSIHRIAGNVDVYFLANTERNADKAVCSFSIEGKQPELWDPVAATMHDLPDYEIKNGSTIIPLKFEASQSFFVVFRKKSKLDKKVSVNFPGDRPVLEISGPWKVQFDPEWGGPVEPILFETLQDWTKNLVPGIKYYSGTAIYRKTFDCEKSKLGKELFIGLGVVHEIARVKLNSTDLGVVWCAPWVAYLPKKVIKTHENRLEIEVTNVWANRLIGDEQEPADCEWIESPHEWIDGPQKCKGWFLKVFPDWFLTGEQRPSKGRYCFTLWNYFTKDSPLSPSGLVGKVQILQKD